MASHRTNNFEGCSRTALRRDAGSLSLQAVFSITAGLLFLFTFVDLVRYVQAINAVHQTARRVARCLSPTDPDCISLPSAPGSLQADWSAPAVVGKTVITQVNRYNYSARMFREHWVAHYDTYEIRKGTRPNVQSTVYKVAQKVFRPALNSFQYVYFWVKATAERAVEKIVFQPKQEPSFPAYLQSEEDASVNSAPSSWTPYGLRKASSNHFEADTGVGFLFSQLSLQAQTEISQKVGPITDHYFEFVTSPVTVPLIVGATSKSICKGASRLTNCSDLIMQEAEGDVDTQGREKTSGDGEWYRFANLALKAFAWIEPAKGTSPAAKWGVNSATRDGLSLEFWNPGDYPRPEKMQRLNLGGRAWSEKSSKPRWYNLWLRGPRSSTGGFDSNYAGIKIPRGGIFRVRARISLNQALSKARVRPVLLYYLNTYIPVRTYRLEQQTKRCLVKQKNLTTAPSCPLTPGDCGFGSEFYWVPGASPCEKENDLNQIPAGETLEKIQAICDAPSSETEYLFPARPVSSGCSQQVQAAVCDDAWKPSSNETILCTPPPGRVFCGWEDVRSPLPERTVGGVPGSCPLATAFLRDEPCEESVSPRVTFRPDKNYGDVSQCTWVKKIRDDTLELNQQQPESAPRFFSPKATWASMRDEQWWFRWIPEEETALGGDCQDRDSNTALCVVHNSIAATETMYAHKDSSWTPTISAFSITPHPGGYSILPSDQAASEKFLKTHVSLSRFGQREPVVLDAIYPFHNKPEFEIPSIETSTVQTLEKQNQAGISSCPSFASLEEELRHFASLSPALGQIVLNQDVVFEPDGTTFETYVDTYRLSEKHSCSQVVNTISSAPKIPDCTPVSVLQKNLTCSEGLYLGRLPLETFPHGPRICTDGTYENCSLKFVDESNGDTSSTPEIDIERATAAGRREFERFIPGASLQCQQQKFQTLSTSCVGIKVHPTARNEFSVEVTYPFEFSHPLKTLLGPRRSSFPIHYLHYEPSEIAAFGRENKGEAVNGP